MVIEMAPMIPRVLAALCAFGSRKAWTPLAIASTPVSAVDPEAKARRIKNSEIEATSALTTRPDEAACGQVPSKHCTKPVIRVTNTVTTKAYVGRANSVLDSLTPRRLARVSRVTRADGDHHPPRRRPGNADVMAATPADTETETVSV